MTVKANDLPTNHLNVNEIKNITSPNSLELGSGKEGEFKDFPVNSFVINLVSRILQMADEDYSVLSPLDRETLRDVLAYKSIREVAKKKHKPFRTIYSRVSTALASPSEPMSAGSKPHKSIISKSALKGQPL